MKKNLGYIWKFSSGVHDIWGCICNFTEMGEIPQKTIHQGTV